MNKLGGITLIEIVVVIAVLSIISIFTFSFFHFHVRTYRDMAIERELYEEATYALERITRELRDAKVAKVNSNPRGLLIQKAHKTPEDPSGIDVVAFLLYSGEIRRRTDPYPTSKPLAKNVGDFFASFIPGRTITEDDSFEIEIKVTKENYSVNLSTVVCPKNLYGTYYFRGRHFHGNYEEVVF